jgi:hypothetical protein
MMIGVAQVMGMKPTLRSFFSGAAAWANTSVAMPSGKNWAMAASAVEAPTAARKARRERSSGNSARTTADSTMRAVRASADASVAASCSLSVA